MNCVILEAETLRAFFDEACDAATEETLPRFRASIGVNSKTDGDFDPVTETDREAETAIAH